MTAAHPNPVVRALSIGWLLLKRPFLLPRVRKPSLEWVEETPIVVWPDILNPVVFRSGEWLARSLAELAPAGTDLQAPAGTDLQAPAGTDLQALDMGTGSGVSAIFSARLGYHVRAVDINPEAVRCARINALLNKQERRIEVIQGDLFAPLVGEKFDLILFNPPFFRGNPKDLFDMAWRGTDVLERFAAGLRGALTATGRALVLLSSDGDAQGMLAALAKEGMTVTPAKRRHFGSEVMTIYDVRP